MKQVRCTNCGSAAIVPDETGAFVKCEACGSTFNVPKATAFSKVELDHTQDIRAWREYLGKQLRLQQDSSKARDYGGVKLFAQKILSVLPDDFCATYYVALAERYDDNDVAFIDFLYNAKLDAATPEELKEIVDSVVASAEPKYADDVKAFVKRAYPSGYAAYEPLIDRNIKTYIQKLKMTRTAERDVFICHRTAAPDQDVADAICSRLEARGLRCWIAPRNILAGSQNYERDILKGVENCKIFLVVSSFKSIYSEDCEMELKAAVLAGKALYSYRIDDTEYDGAFLRALSSVQWLDATDDPYAHLEQLVIDIKGMLAEDAREKAELEEKRLAAREKERQLLEEQRAREKERIERLEKLVSGDIAATAAPSYNYKSRLKRAEIEIGSGNFDRAESIIDDVLDVAPEDPLAWWLLLLCSFRVRSDDELMALDRDFTAHSSFINAERFADAAVQKRVDKAVSAYRVKAVKTVNDILSRAERDYAREDFNALGKTLDECANAFKNEDGLIYRKFPDIASRYYWLRLWAKYGQTPLVCVEDITRETEYKTAMRYASPAQAAEYEKARETVSKNAALFLRERSKNKANDGKLVDYLVDNKNILPVDTYNYYSSLLYFRKMLSELNMTEAQLRRSTADISTNEYFMLAQSIATDAQNVEYDALLATLDKNRADKARSEKQARELKEAEERRKKAAGKVKTAFIIATAVISYVLFFAGILTLDGNDGGLAACMVISSVFRVINNAIMLMTPDSKKSIAFTVVNIVLDAITITISPLAHIVHIRGLSGLAWLLSSYGVIICSFVLEALIFSKRKRKNK